MSTTMEQVVTQLQQELFKLLHNLDSQMQDGQSTTLPQLKFGKTLRVSLM